MPESAFRFWIEFLQPHGAWKPGTRIRTHEDAVNYLCSIGKAKRSTDPKRDVVKPASIIEIPAPINEEKTMLKIEFVNEHGDFKIGERVKTTREVASRLIRQGKAKLLTGPDETKQETREPVTDSTSSAIEDK